MAEMSRLQGLEAVRGRERMWVRGSLSPFYGQSVTPVHGMVPNIFEAGLPVSVKFLLGTPARHAYATVF